MLYVQVSEIGDDLDKNFRNDVGIQNGDQQR